VGVVAAGPGFDLTLESDRKDAADLLGPAPPSSHAPVGDVERPAVVRYGDVDRPEVVDAVRHRKVDLLDNLERRPARSEAERVHLPFAPFGPEPDSAIFLRPDVFLVQDRAARRTAAVLSHPGQMAVGPGVIVVRITVVAAVDVVRHAGPP